MKPENIVFAVAGALFGLIAGWIIGTQQGHARPAAPAAAVASQTTAAQAATPAARPMLDETQVTALKNVADRDATNVESRVQLGNLYFDAERYQEASRWYEEAMALDAGNPNVSTDLAVTYYYTDRADKAITQFEHSLKLDPKHVKSYLNLGIVKAFGKQDLTGAVAAWEQVLAIAPGSQEAQAAQRALDNMKGSHPEAFTAPAAQKPAGS